MSHPGPDELLRAHARPRWSAARQARVRAAVDAALAAPPRPGLGFGRAVVGGLVAAVAVALLVVGVRGSIEPPGAGGTTTAVAPDRPLEAPSTFAEAPRLELADGSSVSGPGAEFELVTAEPELVEVALAAGRIEVSVAPNPARTFRVRSGPVVIEVLGTRFAVVRGDAQTEVEVTEGRVRVRAAGEDAVLAAGDRRTFESATAGAPEDAAERLGRVDHAASPTEGPASEAKASSSRSRPSSRRSEPRDGAWKRLAERGDFAGAARRLGPRPRLQTVEERMLAADAFRLSNHPARAFAVLESVVKTAPDDPRAPLALFTQARLLLDDLKQPQRAAVRFERLRQRYPSSSLVEDALAREAEAWSRAGRADLARERAELYRQRYPDGHRADWVRRFAP